MSGHKTLTQSIETMVQVLENLKNEEYSLEHCMDEFGKAVDSYMFCQDHLSNQTMDVKEVKFVAGQWTENDFDWKGM